MQAGRQKGDLDGTNGKLSRVFTLTGLLGGVGAGRETTNTDNVTTSEVDMLFVEAGGLVVDIVGLGKNLKSCALGTDIVEEKLATGRALDVDSASELDNLGPVGLAVLEVGEFVGELADVVVDVVLQPC